MFRSSIEPCVNESAFFAMDKIESLIVVIQDQENVHQIKTKPGWPPHHPPARHHYDVTMTSQVCKDIYI